MTLVKLVGSLALVGLALTTTACGDGALGGGSCADHKTAADCKADAACKAWGCSTCHGTEGFDVCAPKDDTPNFACPAVACADPCGLLTDGKSCAADSRCEVSGCSDCKGGKQFKGCYGKGTGPDLVCTAVCPNDCAKYTTATDCTADSSCHGIYKNDTTTCKCGVPGCCTTFDHCSDGPAYCTPSGSGPQCLAPQPTCEGDYTNGYAGSCSEGCVRKIDCVTN